MATKIPQEPTALLPKEVTPTKKSYPSISSIPQTTPSRLAATDAETILYLAYGSNLCAETFLGARGIRPVSQVNVSAPSLTLVFDLPGLPYREPCFANTAPRKLPKLPDPSDPPKFPPIPPPPQPPASATIPDPPGWDKGLIGVVYEVTPSDYATIVATEGGGSSYADILVPCFVLPPRVSVPEKPPIDIPRPFLAHTLYSPAVPDAEPEKKKGGENDDGDDDKTPEDPRKKWYYRFVKPPRRPDPTYAQPSARYLKLITDGAAEHELPDDYQRWLRSLQPYTVTSWRQRVAQILLVTLFFPLVMVFFFVNKLVADKEGKLPLWSGVVLNVLFNLVWMTHDKVLKPVFGDGERTEEEKEEEEEFKEKPRRRWKASVSLSDEEKKGLLENMD